MRVLLVEDDADLREALAAVLDGRGFEAYPAQDCAEAAAVAKSWRPDVVVADLHGCGDPAPLARLGLPVVLASGSDEGYLAAAARRLGAAATLRKPFDAGDLVAAVRGLRHPTA